jgi:hypothetical protein
MDDDYREREKKANARRTREIHHRTPSAARPQPKEKRTFHREGRPKLFSIPTVFDRIDLCQIDGMRQRELAVVSRILAGDVELTVETDRKSYKLRPMSLQLER